MWKDDSLMIEKELMGLWLNTLASKSPVPGGGGASAIGGALAAALGQMVALLEPVMILFMALIVGSIVMAVMIPVFNMYSSML